MKICLRKGTKILELLVTKPGYCKPEKFRWYSETAAKESEDRKLEGNTPILELL